jgi:hypothetical protein
MTNRGARLALGDVADMELAVAHDTASEPVSSTQ